MDWLSGERPLILGHRGASGTMPENTLPAFDQALQAGAVGSEFDVRLSADGVPMVIHDDRVERTTDGTGCVAELMAAELQAFDAGGGAFIPSLDDVFHTFGPRMLYNIEIKDDNWRDRGTEAAVADLIESYRLESQVLVSSFYPLTLIRARRHMTRSIRLGFLHGKRRNRPLALLLPVTAVHPHFSLVDERYMDWARRRDYLVNVWTVDNPAEAQRLAALGVHSIISNVPGLIREGLQ